MEKSLSIKINAFLLFYVLQRIRMPKINEPSLVIFKEKKSFSIYQMQFQFSTVLQSSEIKSLSITDEWITEINRLETVSSVTLLDFSPSMKVHWEVCFRASVIVDRINHFALPFWASAEVQNCFFYPSFNISCWQRRMQMSQF